jgi:uncharacterized protein YgbK (DUF1537 family)
MNEKGNKMFKRLKSSTKIRVVSGSVSFYTTAKQIRSGVGDFSAFNVSVQKALEALESQRVSIPSCTGLAGNWVGIVTQIDIQA